jgi:hypothetical protein
VSGSGSSFSLSHPKIAVFWWLLGRRHNQVEHNHQGGNGNSYTCLVLVTMIVVLSEAALEVADFSTIGKKSLTHSSV